MSLPIKTAQFAEIRIIAESLDFSDSGHESTGGIPVQDNEEPNNVITHTIGIATSIRFREELGSTQKNVIGTPVPIFIPGYYQATITAEKATLDLESWKTMANINPYTAYLPNTYDANGVKSINISDPDIEAGDLNASEGRIPRFLFALYVYDRIQEEASKPTGVYIGMLQSYNTALTAQEAVIMEDITFLARPVSGSWFSALKGTFNLSTFFGYDSEEYPQENLAATIV